MYSFAFDQHADDQSVAEHKLQFQKWAIYHSQGSDPILMHIVFDELSQASCWADDCHAMCFSFLAFGRRQIQYHFMVM